MLNQKQFGCLKFLSVNFNDTQVCKGETSRKTTIHNLNNIRDTGRDTENTVEAHVSMSQVEAHVSMSNSKRLLHRGANRTYPRPFICSFDHVVVLRLYSPLRFRSNERWYFCLCWVYGTGAMAKKIIRR